MPRITRTIVNSTEIKFRTVIDGEISVPQSLGVAGKVLNPVALVKRKYGLKKLDSVIIDEVHEDKALYWCSIEDFLSVAHPVE